jgi:outer membrane immunogenic protein
LTLQVANTPLVLAPPLNPGTTSASFSHNKAGWTIGAGVETRLWGGLTAKLEYLYVDLGTYSDSFVIPGNAATVPGSTLSTTTLSRFTDHIVRAGLNYKFDWGAPLAKY